jgi:hypothetical protein
MPEIATICAKQLADLPNEIKSQIERNISTDDLLDVLTSGEVIEEYPDDEPCPSALILGFINHTIYIRIISGLLLCIFPKMENGLITA